MLRKIANFPIVAYFAVTGFLSNLKKDERGLAIVEVVLLILVAVLAVVFFWDQIKALLESLFAKITGKANSIDGIGSSGSNGGGAVI